MDCAAGPGNVCQCVMPVHVRDCYSQEFEVKIWVHQGYVLIPLCFVNNDCQFHSRVLWEELYVDDLLLEALDMERSHGRERVVTICRKDKGHDVRYSLLAWTSC